MFQLKDYQKETLTILEKFLKNSRQTNPRIAYTELTQQSYKPISTLESVPYICLRLPTGGGKTFLAAHSISIAAKSYLEQDFPVVLWLTPTKTIKEQTVETLKNIHHPNRQVLEETFKGEVEVFDIVDFINVKPNDLKNKVCVFVSTFQSFRVEDTEGRKIYDHNENLEPHFSQIPQTEYSHLNLERYEKKIKFSFANLLHVYSPLVIVDEAHNNNTDLSYEVMNRVNPSCIIEFTATPAQNSNILYKVTAMELKSEEMIKLPIMLTEYPSWQEAVEASVIKRKGLDDIAKTDKDYIRPIVLIQAESKDKNITVDVIKDYLINNSNILPEKIAVATGNQRELDGINVLDPKCPIEFVITIQALKEGWDCPFAYVFCSVASVHSKTVVEQLLGRVLRMPYAKTREHQDLNKAYAFVSSDTWQNAIAKLSDNLINMGFEEVEQYIEPMEQLSFNCKTEPLVFTQNFVCKLNTNKLTDDQKQLLELKTDDNGISSITISNNLSSEIKEAVISAITTSKQKVEFKRTLAVLENKTIKLSPFDEGVRITVPQLCLFINNHWELAVETNFLNNGWNIFDYPARLDPAELDILDNGTTVEFDIENKQIIAKHYQNTLPLHFENINTEMDEDDLSRWITLKMEHIDLSYAKILKFTREIIVFLTNKQDIPLSLLIIRKFKLLNAIQNKINQYRKEANKKSYQLQLFENDNNVKTDYDFKPFEFSDKYMIREYYKGAKRFNKHLYSSIEDMNSEEVQCAIEIDMMPEVKYWVRNIEKTDYSFSLPTSTDKFYPDFVALLNDGRIYVIEYKGANLISNDDSKEKDSIGKFWAKKSNGKCLFKMVSDEKTKMKSITNQLKEEL